MKQADWVISNDSGPMHLAAALGVNVFAHLRADRPAPVRAVSDRRPANHVIQAPVGDLRLLTARDVYARFQRIRAPLTRARATPKAPTMLDPKLVRESPELVRAAIAKKHLAVDLDSVLGADAAWRALLQEVEHLRSVQKAANSAMAALPKGSPEFLAKVARDEGGLRPAQGEGGALKAAEESCREAMLTLPNLPHASVPEGEGPSRTSCSPPTATRPLCVRTPRRTGTSRASPGSSTSSAARK